MVEHCIAVNCVLVISLDNSVGVAQCVFVFLSGKKLLHRRNENSVGTLDLK